MARSTRRKHRMAEMNVVPYIDVMLVLLIIFMITSPLLTEGVNVQLPKAGQGTQTLDASNVGNIIIVTLDSWGQLHLQAEETAISANELTNRVKALAETIQQKGGKARVYVRGDTSVQYGKIIEIMAMLKAVGIDEVSLVTQKQ
ncbi:biopolymer transport protein [Beggiatoa alba B18LD]|uniref:Biopolymer transport protein n=1 Tax=Beggiatoa alba B18LD TaxID=395493 RepID=I3CGS5_9GAMM|nr:ExbD/TolR family protein [Beggiatoa alba]EIJ42818.1 biopolymer transport protein [Beggiatoa alba B18LD]